MNNKQISRLTGRKVESADKVNRVVTDSRRARNIIVILAIIAALQMISFGIIIPIFPRRLGDFGGGVEALGLMAMAYSITSIAAAPFMGSLADRYGRRPLLLGSLAAYVLAFTGYLLATSTESFIVIRALAGVLTAGLGPATMGIVSDIAPENERARWIGIVGGGSSVGWIIGPPLGGLLYDKWGYAAPFIVSVAMAAIALIAAFVMVQETRTGEVRQSEKRQRIRPLRKGPATAQPISIRNSLPRPLPTFAVLLSISFIMIFAWTFAEPKLMFYIYDDLGWTSARFGLAMSGYGVAS
ncbi:MAG: MFS transporter, partial [Candidatus Promineifilaceae bacterium]